MLHQPEEPPQSSPRHGFDASSAGGATIIPLARHGRFPRHYLAVEGFRLYPLTIEVKPLFERYASFIPQPLSDYTFANNLIWLSQKSGFYGIIEDCFCLFSLHGEELTMLLPPLGRPASQYRALASCFEIMDRYNPFPASSQVEYVYRGFAEPLDAEGWLVETGRPDYIYVTEDLIQLRGNAYKTKRSEINQFCRRHPDHRLETLGPQHWDGIRMLLNTWLVNRLQYLGSDAVADFLHTVEQERQAIERALKHYEALGLTGLVLIIGGRIEGFTFGERITPHIASVLVEKTNFAIPGAAQYLFREFAKTFADCTYINVGDDLGLENLRRVKMSYRPAYFGEKVTIRRRLPDPRL